MDKRKFAKLMLMGMAAGSLIGSQQVTAEEALEAIRGENLLAASCGGPNGCKSQPSEYRYYTADNDAGYSQGSSYYQGSSSPSSTYYNTSSQSMNPYQSGYTPSGSSSYHSSPSSTQGYGESSYYNTGSQSQYPSSSQPSSTMQNYNRSYPNSTSPSTHNMQGGSSQYNTTPSNPTSYQDPYRNSTRINNYLTAVESEDVDLAQHEQENVSGTLLADDNSDKGDEGSSV